MKKGGRTSLNQESKWNTMEMPALHSYSPSKSLKERTHSRLQFYRSLQPCAELRRSPHSFEPFLVMLYQYYYFNEINVNMYK